MHMIVYTSRATAPHNVILDEIVSTAMRNNAARDITGALFYDNGTFLQVLEGKLDTLTHLMATIESDTRHQALNVLINQPIKERTLDGWSMQQINLADLSSFHELNIELFSDAMHKLVQPRADRFVETLKCVFSSSDVNRVLLETI